MTNIRWLSTVLLLGGLVAFGPAAMAGPQQRFEEAIDLIHTGQGNNGAQVQAIAEELATSEPKSGYAQTLEAEWISTVVLEQNGEPADMRDAATKLADEALALNPGMTYAHVPKARVLVRTRKYDLAEVEITAALKADPKMSGAIFLRADIARRRVHVEEAETWFAKFIASTPNPQRKANAYYWLARMTGMLADNNPDNFAEYHAKTVASYEQMAKLNPGAAFGQVDYAIYLNNVPADFARAEKYARRVLKISDFPMARHQLAAALYQKLNATAGKMGSAAIARAVDAIAKDSGVTLDDAIRFNNRYSTRVTPRLRELQSRLASPATPPKAL